MKYLIKIRQRRLIQRRIGALKLGKVEILEFLLFQLIYFTVSAQTFDQIGLHLVEQDPPDVSFLYKNLFFFMNLIFKT